MSASPAAWRRWIGAFFRALLLLPLRVIRAVLRTLRVGLYAVAIMIVAVIFGNTVFQAPRGVPFRALDPATETCRSDAGWDVLASPASAADGTPGVANDEWWAIDHGGALWRQRFACAIQHHIVPGYHAPDGSVKPIGYDLAFLEFQEDGKSYALRSLCHAPGAGCTDEGYGLVRREQNGQLEAVLDRLKQGGPHYVMAFVHGWRNNADIGNANVSEFRTYAAHVARFLEDRAALDPAAPKPSLTAIYVGWRGARTDESFLQRKGGVIGAWVGAFSAALTLFDRKPVSEAIAPVVLTALRQIEAALNINQPLADPNGLPQPQPNKMIVIGHSLGGNVLASALEADVVKAVERQTPGSYMLPVLGDLVVLINPAAEATKWTAIQRAVFDRIAVTKGERRPIADYIASHAFFRPEQRPILMSVTAALDWPPGGFREIDCVPHAAVTGSRAVSQNLARKGVDYDWATYDLFPAFKLDFRPVADTLTRIATNRDPHDPCQEDSAVPVSGAQAYWGPVVETISAFLRVLPFMQTDPEQTRTIGQLDPPRGPGHDAVFSERPFGTTHEVRGWAKEETTTPRAWSGAGADEAPREIPVDYDAAVGPNATCPVATGWLDEARRAALIADPNAHATRWTSRHSGASPPALVFQHGFAGFSLPAITRANDPFWNVRAFDTALARHDGYMLSSFICALNQFVMDDPTVFPPAPPPASPVATTPSPPLSPPVPAEQR